jgi:hypothetical protein
MEWKWLFEDGHAHWFAEAQVWLQEIGAMRTGAYLAETAAAFPEGRVPEDDSKRAHLLLERGELDARLRELDHTYEGAFDKMAECLRSYIQHHFELFRTELEDESNRAV